MVSLGCPKALVDSERILTRLRADGYAMSPDYAGADVVVVNTCGFLDSAKEESLEAIGEAIAENGRVIVTGCMGEEADVDPRPLPRSARGDRGAPVRAGGRGGARGRAADAGPFVDLIPQPDDQADPAALQLPQDLRGLQPQLRLLHHPAAAREARQPADRRGAARGREAGRRRHQELLVISQDTSAYGVDIRHEERTVEGPPGRAHMTDLARELGGCARPRARCRGCGCTTSIRTRTSTR
jgi:ribosomal protein S12 methylthiotransferase